MFTSCLFFVFFLIDHLKIELINKLMNEAIMAVINNSNYYNYYYFYKCQEEMAALFQNCDS